MTASRRVVVIGAGQAGLAVSHQLTGRGIEHEVLERAAIGSSWRGRWDSFCLVTPNWTMNLPGAPYAGDDPEGFVPRDEIVRYLEQYASSFGAPVRGGVSVDSLAAAASGGFVLHTSEDEIRADTVVVCTGAFQRPHLPEAAASFPPGLPVLDPSTYRSPAMLPPGRVLVIGSGQTGCQIAEELVLSGREVFQSCGRAPWLPRRLAGRDIVTWLNETTFFDQRLSDLPAPAARLGANVLVTGQRGGHDLNLRTLQASGVVLLGRLIGVDGGRARFADDLADAVAFGDARFADVRTLVTDQLRAKGVQPPEWPAPPPFGADAPLELDLRGFGAVIVTAGFRPDYARWIHFPAFDPMGFPVTIDGASRVVPGLYFCGVHFLRTRKSALLFGVGDDAAVVAESIAVERRGHRGSSASTL